MPSTSLQPTYSAWTPAPDVPAVLYLEGLRDESPVLVLSLRGEDSLGPILRLEFTGVRAYRNINESYRMRTWSVWAGRGLGSLFTVEQSHWLEWLDAESVGLIGYGRQLRHYAVYTPEDCVDIACTQEPRAQWIPARGP